MLGATAKSNPTASKLDEKELARLQRQDHWIVLSRWKLLMDLVFVCKFYHTLTAQVLRHRLMTLMHHMQAYNVFGLKRAKSSVQTFTGLAAALLR